MPDLSKIPVAELWQHMGPFARIAALPVYGYRYTLSPYIGHACRHQPTCSVYALEALATFGALQGTYLSTRRLLRCHPWGSKGYDPVRREEED